MSIELTDIDKDITIIDIRTSNEFESYHLDGSINIPRIKLLNNHESYLNKNKDYYIICNKGKVSLSCCKILNALGYSCKSIIGGIDPIIAKRNTKK